MNQLELHKKIEEFFKAGISSADVKVAQDLLTNDDARRFFFSQADERWFNWLWNEGFLDEVKNKADNPTRVAYRMPELEYLTRIAEKNVQLNKIKNKKREVIKCYIENKQDTKSTKLP